MLESIRTSARRRAWALLAAGASLPAAAAQSSHVLWGTPVPLAEDALADAVHAQPDGSVFAAIGETSLAGSNARARLVRFDSLGGIDFTVALGTARREGEISLAGDGAGGVFLATTLTSAGFADPPLGGADILLARFDGDGNLIFAQRVGTAGFEALAEIVADGSGGVFMVGQVGSTGSFGGAPIGGLDAFAARYSATGAELWVRRVGVAGTSHSFVTGASDLAGGLIAAGRYYSSTFGGPSAGLYARFDGQGNPSSPPTYGWQTATVRDIEPDGAGGSISTYYDEYGTTAFERRDASGNILWWTSLEPSGPAHSQVPLAVARLADGTPVLAGTVSGAGFFRAVDGAGNTLWTRTIGEVEAIGTLADDGRGAIVAAGWFRRPNPGTQPIFTPWVGRIGREWIGTPGCAGVPNSTGAPAECTLAGSLVAAEGNLTVSAQGLPPGANGYFLTSRTSGFASQPGGSQGDLCLGGAIGRFVRPGEVQNAGEHGRMLLLLDLTDLPTPIGSAPGLAGQTWHFQGWYRDANPAPTSNFTGSVSATLQ